jgi:phage gp29-like protein
VLYDPHGRPVSVARLKREQATPEAGRPLKLEDLDSMTPGRLRRIFKAQDEGEIHDLVAYASNVERLDGHIGAQIGVRKLAVCALPWKVEPVNEDERGKAIAAEVRELIAEPAWCDLIAGLQGAVLGPYAAVEILWDTSSSQWRPRAYEARDLRWLKTVDGVPHLRNAAGDGVEPLNPYGWAIHRTGRYSGPITRDGLARGLSALRLMKSLGARAWLQFAEVCGLPFRLVRYPDDASTDEQDLYKAMARDLGLDGWAAIPMGAEVEFVEPKSATEGDFHQRLCDWCDAQASKLIVFQTMTADSGASRSQSETHKSMLDMAIANDSRRVCATAKAAAIDPYLALNHGPDTGRLVKVSQDCTQPLSVDALIETACKLGDRGVPVETSQLLEALRLRQAGQGEGALIPKIGNAA